MVDSFTFEARSSTDNWHSMTTWDIPGSDAAYFASPNPAQSTPLQPTESFLDKLKTRNIAPGETIQGWVFLTIKSAWNGHDLRLHIRDIFGEESTDEFSLSGHTGESLEYQVQKASLKVPGVQVDIRGRPLVTAPVPGHAR